MKRWKVGLTRDLLDSKGKAGSAIAEALEITGALAR